MSPIPLGILAASGAETGLTFELISTQTLSATASSISFSSIPQTYKHLQLRYSAKCVGGSGTFYMTFNNVSAGYAAHALRGNGANVGSAAYSNASSIQMTSAIASNATPAVFSGAIVNIADYANVSKNKTMQSLHGYADPYGEIHLDSGLLTSTSAITSITLSQSQLISIGSRFSLYGIRG